MKKYMFLALLAGVTILAAFWIKEWESPSVSDQDRFRFPLFSEPHSLDPLKETSTTARYLLPNLFRGLYLYQEGKLEPVGAHQCVWRNELTIHCTLSLDFKYSTGETVVAEDYLRTFRLLLSSEHSHPLAELLFPVKNARLIASGHAQPEELGVYAKGEFLLEFLLEQPFQEFLYVLAHPILSPRPDGVSETDYLPTNAKNIPFTGPYQVEEWSLGQKLLLSPRSDYPHDNPAPLKVEILFVEDDATNFRLYRQGRVDWLRRLPTHEIPNYKSDAAFRQIPLARFDYLGFGPQLKNQRLLRMALAHALNYGELAKIYHALGRPGCPSLPRSYMSEVPCYDFDLQRAKELYQRHLKEEVSVPELTLAYSKLGGDDVEKGMVWAVEQWRANLGIEVSLEPLEQGTMLHRLWNDPPTIFRKGVSLDRPSCAAGLEIFDSMGSERFLSLDHPHLFEQIKSLVRTPRNRPEEQAESCTEAVKTLLESYALVPLGEIHMSMLISDKFSGIRFNELHQLDLSQLRKVKPL